MPVRLIDREPVVRPERLLQQLVPPPQFAEARFATYVPDPAEPSQAQAVALLEGFSAGLPPAPKRLFARAKPPVGRPGVYLDGGFGVGKSHLLAALWHASPEPKAYATFVELTHLVGALGFADTVAGLSGHRLLCIDEFELDDPGDTVMLSTLLARLVASGVNLAATSNTLPDALGEGRFAATDFLREVQGLASHFSTLRIDGQDYRHRGLASPPAPLSQDALRRLADKVEDASYDGFESLLDHLARLHPSRYGALVQGLALVCLDRVVPLFDQSAALRFVVFVDRLYDAEIPVATSGLPVDELFVPELLGGGYRKKYLRALSRLTALVRAGAPAATSSPAE